MGIPGSILAGILFYDAVFLHRITLLLIIQVITLKNIC